MNYFQGWIDNVSKLLSKVVYSGWITHRLALLKRFILKKTVPVESGGKYLFIIAVVKISLADTDSFTFLVFIISDMGKLEVVDDLLTGVFYLFYLFHMLQYFEVQTGLAIKVCFNDVIK